METARYPHPGKSAFLGAHGQYDLYVGYQDPLPPTLIARFGAAPPAYATYNPTLMGTDYLDNATGEAAIDEAMAAFRTALERAKAAGLM